MSITESEISVYIKNRFLSETESYTYSDLSQKQVHIHILIQIIYRNQSSCLIIHGTSISVILLVSSIRNLQYLKLVIYLSHGIVTPGQGPCLNTTIQLPPGKGLVLKMPRIHFRNLDNHSFIRNITFQKTDHFIASENN